MKTKKLSDAEAILALKAYHFQAPRVSIDELCRRHGICRQAMHNLVRLRSKQARRVMPTIEAEQEVAVLMRLLSKYARHERIAVDKAVPNGEEVSLATFVRYSEPGRQ